MRDGYASSPCPRFDLVSAAITGSSVRACDPMELRPVGEVEFVQGLAAASASGVYGRCRAVAGSVGRADLKPGDGSSVYWRRYGRRPRTGFASSATR